MSEFTGGAGPRDFDGEIRVAGPEDAGQIALLVRRCYGSSHPVPAAYDPEQLRSAIAQRRVTYVIAAASSGELAGQAALDPGGAPGLFELGRAIVHEDWRDAGVFSQIGKKALAIAPGLGARFVLGRVVTSHLAAQRFGPPNGLTTVGLLLGMFPASVRAAGVRPTRQAISAVVHARSFEEDPQPRRLALEGRDLELAALALARLGIPRSDGRLPAAPPLGARVVHDDHFGVAHVRFTAGASERLEPETLSDLERSGARILWADVPAEHRDAARFAERLRALGFGFAAYVPGAGESGEDVLRLQRYLEPRPLDPSQIHVLEDAVPFKEAVLAEIRSAEPVAA